ncbi:MAG: hypothetical protein ACI4AA_00650 [Lachnospiraceae bacterium]
MENRKCGNRKKIMIIVLALLLVVIILIIILVRMLSNKNYIDNDVFGDVRYIFQYENLKEEKGEVLKEKLVNADMWLAVFDDIKVLYHYQTDTNTVGHFMWAQIDNDEYKFGKQQLAAGMSRETIEKALKNSKRPEPCIQECELFDSEGNVYEGITEDYYDDVYDYGMGFVFDKDDCVKYIRIYFGL